MNLTSPSEVKAWCIREGFHPNRVLGQNFLIDRNTLEAILDASPLEKGGRVLEIGPGLGVLTEALASRGCLVTAIEKDPVLAARLSLDGVDVIAGDALDEIAKGTCDGIGVMVSNLPYQAGTRILLELALRGACRPESMTVLVQTEVAERLKAGPGSKTRGLSGVWIQLDYEVSIVREVPPSCFWPRPEIGSSVVRLKRHHLNDNLSESVRGTFARLTKRAFEHRRKQMGSIFKGIVESTLRPEALSNEDWLLLAIQLEKGKLI